MTVQQIKLPHYETLGVDENATAAEIKAAWRRKARQRHPDRSTGDDAEFIKAREAYEVLSDPGKREEYDLSGVVVDMSNIDGEASDEVCRIFLAYLTMEEECFDPAMALYETVRQKLQEVLREKRKAERLLETARRRRKSMRNRGGGHDLFAVIAKRRVMAAYATLQHIKRGEAVFRRAIEIADDYENGEPPEPQAVARTYYLTGSIT